VGNCLRYCCSQCFYSSCNSPPDSNCYQDKNSLCNQAMVLVSYVSFSGGSPLAGKTRGKSSEDS